MKSPHRRAAVASVVVSLLASCGGGQDGDAPSGGGDSGGNVGFGGAQDIGQFRHILDEGGIPGADTLDANGFFNEHYTELPPPDCGQVMCAHGMLSIGKGWADDAPRTTLQVALNTPQSPDDLERLPLNLVVVLDTSGSMIEDDRLAYAKLGLHRLVDSLVPGDRLALVTYSTGVTVWNDLATDTPASVHHDRIAALSAAGSTNIYDGLAKGLEIAATSLDFERQNRVILVSDGLATAGNTDSAAIISMAESFIGEGIGVTTMGVGLDFNVELMRGLAERGAGNFYFLEDALAIEEVFTEEIDTFMSPLALELSLEVAADGAYSLGEVVGTRLWQTDGERGTIAIPAAFIASRTSEEPGPNGRRGGGSTLFVRMIPRSSFEDPYQVATIELSYRLPGSADRISQTITVSNPFSPSEPPEDEYYSQEIVAQHDAMYDAYHALRAVALTADSDYSCAAAIALRAEQRAQAWNAAYADVDIAADLQLLAQFRGNLEATGGYADDCTDGGDAYPPDDTWPPENDDEGYDGGLPFPFYGCGCNARGGAGGGALTIALVACALLLSQLAASRGRSVSRSRRGTRSCSE